MINVTSTYLPPMSRYVALLEQIWESGQLTNGGPLCVQLEKELSDWLDVPHVVLVANGTLALQMAIRALHLKERVITTPYSYVATTSSLVWEGCQPHFVDVDSETLCLDSRLVRESFDEGCGASGIVATHVYGLPCDVEGLEAIAQDRSVPLLFDAAHAFGVRRQGRSLLAFGDASVLSFHATKLFHTAEGGAVVTTRPDVADRVRQLRNFGHVTPESFDVVGVNAKMSELHAAMGLAVLVDLEAIVEARRLRTERYDQLLVGSVSMPARPPDMVPNYAYYPILLKDQEERETVLMNLLQEGVSARRYFSPALNTLPYVNSPAMPVAEDAARRALCLPLSAALALQDVERIAKTVIRGR